MTENSNARTPEVQYLVQVFRELCERAEVAFGVFKHGDSIAHLSKYPENDYGIISHLVSRFSEEYVDSTYNRDPDETDDVPDPDEVQEDLGLVRRATHDVDLKVPSKIDFSQDLTFFTESELHAQVQALGASAVFAMLVRSPAADHLDLKIWALCENPLMTVGLMQAGYVFWKRELGIDLEDFEDDDLSDDDEDEEDDVFEFELEFEDEEDETDEETEDN